MTIRILCQGDGAISGRHYKPKPQIVTRAASVSSASNAQTNSRLSGAMRGKVCATGSSRRPDEPINLRLCYRNSENFFGQARVAQRIFLPWKRDSI
jgi:hypothetical protein